MDDISAAIRSVLSDPESMAQIQSIVNALGTEPAAAPAPQTSALSVPQSAPQNGGDPMMAMLLKAAPLLTAVNQEDDATRLLQALRPLLSEPRRKKLDEASRILKILHILPLLKESGILQNLF